MDVKCDRQGCGHDPSSDTDERVQWSKIKSCSFSVYCFVFEYSFLALIYVELSFEDMVASKEKQDIRCFTDGGFGRLMQNDFKWLFRLFSLQKWSTHVRCHLHTLFSSFIREKESLSQNKAKERLSVFTFSGLNIVEFFLTNNFLLLVSRWPHADLQYEISVSHFHFSLACKLHYKGRTLCICIKPSFTAQSVIQNH